MTGKVQRSTPSTNREEDSRGETFSDNETVTETNRRARFPSLHTGPEEFVTVPWNERRNTDEKIKLTVTERIWYWLCGIPRKIWLIIGAILICLLSLLIVGLILTFVLPHHSAGQAEPQVTGTTEATTSAQGTTTTPINYPIIVNIGTETTWFPIGFMESMAPDNRGYDFRNRILVYNPNSTYLLLNGTLWNALMKITQPNDCTGCKLLSATDGCLLSGNSCTNNAAIFCCDRCQSIPQVCLLHGNTIITSGKLVEWRISSGGEQLLLTNAFDMGDNTAIMTTRANNSIFFQSGPLEIFPTPVSVPQAALTIDPNDSNQTDLLIWVNSTGYLIISYQQVLFPIDLEISGPVLSIDTTLYGTYVLIVVLQWDVYYLVRFNLENRCISRIPMGTKYFNTGQMKGSFWGGDKYYLWYNDNRGKDGVTLMRFSFYWPQDSHCILSL